MKIFRSHMGLGDHIICNAIVRHLAEEDIVIVPVKRHYETSMKFMYSDDPRIKVAPFDDDAETDRYCRFMAKEGLEVIWNGNVGQAKKIWGKSGRQWDRRFYEQMNLDFNLRWDRFKLPKNSCDWKKLFHMRFPGVAPKNFIFLHHTSSTGVKKIRGDFIRNQYKFIPDTTFTDNIFDYVELIENAREIHCINSSFLCLADSLNLKGKLHFHASAQDLNFNSPTLKSNWIIHPMDKNITLLGR